jgi:hypothetical protein
MRRLGLTIIVAVALVVPATARAEGEAAALAAHAGVAESTAVQDLEAQQQDPDVVSALQETFHANYGGVWFDNTTAQFVVNLPPGASQAQAEIAMAGAPARYVPVKHTELALQAYEATLAAGLAGYSVQVMPDVQENTVTVAEGNTLTLDQEFAVAVVAMADGWSKRITPHFKWGETITPVVAASCSFPYCAREIRSGVRIEAERPAENGNVGQKIICSAGFLAYNSSGTYLLTAGHCLAPPLIQGEPWFTGGGGVCNTGLWSQWELDENGDDGLLGMGNCGGEYKVQAWGYKPAPLPLKTVPAPITCEWPQAEVFTEPERWHKEQAEYLECLTRRLNREVERANIGAENAEIEERNRNPEIPIRGGARPYLGQWECHYGARSLEDIARGESVGYKSPLCGTVKTPNRTIPLRYELNPGESKVIAVQHTYELEGACALPGDSGGPMIAMSDGWAVGEGIVIGYSEYSCATVGYEALEAAAHMGVTIG